jgi:hypothetical protein
MKINQDITGELSELHGQLREKKYFDYFVFNIVDCDLLHSGARHQPAPE